MHVSGFCCDTGLILFCILRVVPHSGVDISCDLGSSLFVAGAVFGDLCMSFFVVGAVFGDVVRLLESVYQMRSRSGKANGRVPDWWVHARVMLRSAEHWSGRFMAFVVTLDHRKV